MFDNGNEPYCDPEIGTSTEDLIKYICSGRYPGRPAGVTDAIWTVMESCFNQKITDRPTFEEILESVKAINEKISTFTS